MAKNLVIVESPAKAKTIEKFLGPDFTVASSYGHIADLPSKEIGVDVLNGFKPTYEVSADKKALVSKLKVLAKNADMVWLASDEDREGEAISWHLSEELKLDKKKTKRIVFHEITKTAILKAIENPREIDYNLVNAQQARRVLDRLVGYELSPVLWRKIKGGLSAGRVQSVAVRLIVEREREIINFKAVASYTIVAEFVNQNGQRLANDAIDGVADTMHDVRNEAAPMIDRASEKAAALAKRGANALRDTTQQLRDQALKASDTTVMYIKDEPLKSMLIAAATGAALMALIAMLGRSRYR